MADWIVAAAGWDLAIAVTALLVATVVEITLLKRRSDDRRTMRWLANGLLFAVGYLCLQMLGLVNSDIAAWFGEATPLTPIAAAGSSVVAVSCDQFPDPRLPDVSFAPYFPLGALALATAPDPSCRQCRRCLHGVLSAQLISGRLRPSPPREIEASVITLAKNFGIKRHSRVVLRRVPLSHNRETPTRNACSDTEFATDIYVWFASSGEGDAF